MQRAVCQSAVEKRRKWNMKGDVRNLKQERLNLLRILMPHMELVGNTCRNPFPDVLSSAWGANTVNLSVLEGAISRSHYFNARRYCWGWWRGMYVAGCGSAPYWRIVSNAGKNLKNLFQKAKDAFNPAKRHALLTDEWASHYRALLGKGRRRKKVMDICEAAPRNG